MPKTRDNRLGRAVLMVLLSFWVVPILVLGHHASGVSAQGGAGTPPDPTLPGGAPAGKMTEPIAAGGQKVMVLEFTVRAGLDPALGRRASDALAVSLGQSGYDVVPKQQLMEAINRMPGVTPPLDKASQLLLAKDLGVQSYFTGTVQEVQPPKSGRARATIDTLQTDSISGDAINGARATAEASALQSPGPDVLIDEALNQAAGRLVAQMRLVRVITGTVLVSGTLGDATLNVGSRNGVRPGDRFSVTRRTFDRMANTYVTQKVGELEVQSVESSQAVARILNAAGGIEVQDKVTRVFELPPPSAITTLRTGQARKGLNTLVLPVVALGLLVGAISGGGGQATGSPENIVATAGSTPGTVLLSWSRNSGVFSDQDIAAFIIHRSSVRGAFSELTTGRDVRCGPFFTYTDFTGQIIGGAAGGGGGGGGNTVTIALTGGQGGGGGGGQQGGGGNVVTCTAGQGGGGGGGGGQQGASSIQATMQPNLATLPAGLQVFYNVEQVTKVPPPPPEPTGGGQQGGGGQLGGGGGQLGGGGGQLGGGGGQLGGGGGQLGFQRRILRQLGGGGGGQQQGQTLELRRSFLNATGSGGATPLDRVFLQSPANGDTSVTLSRVTFQWRPVTGADSYLIQISADPTRTFSPATLATANGAAIAETFSTSSLTISQALTNIAVPGAVENTVILWRVGARNSRDDARPRSLGTANDNGYVWSDPFSFQVAPAPPGAPAFNRTLRSNAKINHVIQQSQGALLQRMLRARGLQPAPAKY